MLMQESEKQSIVKQLPPEIWKIIFKEFTTKELWKTCATSRYWSYLIINTLVSRLKKKPLDICRFYGDFLQPSKEPYITCIPFNSSCMNFSYDDYLIHIKQPQPIILGKWVSRSVGFVPWCQQESNKKNVNSLNYNNKNNLKYYAENPPTIYCWFCSPYNVDKEIPEFGNVSSMYDLPKAENCLLSNLNYFYQSSLSMDRNYFHSYYSNTYNNSSYMIPSYNTSSSGRYQTNSYYHNSSNTNIANNNKDENNNINDNNMYSSSDRNILAYSLQYQNRYQNQYQYNPRQNINNNQDYLNIKNSKKNDNNNVDIYEISIGKGMAKLKYELVNVEENPLTTLSSSPTDTYYLSPSYNKNKVININNNNNNSSSNRNYDRSYNNSNFQSSSPKNSSKSIEGNCQMSINDFIGNINSSYNVVSPKNPQGNYSNLIMDYYNPNLMTYSNMNYINNNNYKKSDTIIEVKIIELIIHPSAIFS